MSASRRMLGQRPHIMFYAASFSKRIRREILGRSNRVNRGSADDRLSSFASYLDHASTQWSYLVLLVVAYHSYGLLEQRNILEYREAFVPCGPASMTAWFWHNIHSELTTTGAERFTSGPVQANATSNPGRTGFVWRREPLRLSLFGLYSLGSLLRSPHKASTDRRT